MKRKFAFVKSFVSILAILENIHTSTHVIQKGKPEVVQTWNKFISVSFCGRVLAG